MITIQGIYDLALKLGLAADPRGPQGVKKYLAKVKRDYEALSAEEKKYFNKSKLADPYADSDIHLADKRDRPVKRVLVGIDIDVGEVLLADRLKQLGKPVDVVIAHHPFGSALVDLHEVMLLQVDVMHAHGVPLHVAENLMEERINQVGRGIHSINHFRGIDAARLLGVNLMNLHTLTDNLVDKFVGDFLKKQKPESVGQVIKALLALPEYQEAKKFGAGPRLLFGRPGNRAGKIMTEMTGGTEAGEKVYQELSRAGVSTLVSMHMAEKNLEQAKNAMLNVIIAGHISSDSLGLNLFLDELEKRGVEVVPCSGLIRVKRVK